MEASLESEIIRSYKRLSYTHWHALSEFVDNSTQAYFNNRQELDATTMPRPFRLEIRIKYDRPTDTLTIRDNAIGMTEAELERAMKIGMPPENTTGRSKYGLGLKTAACWFGDLWTLETKKLNEPSRFKIIFDVDKVARGDRDLQLTSADALPTEHYTKIEITQLSKKFVGRTTSKVKEHLRSFYRKDIDSFLDLYWNDEKLSWNQTTQIDADLISRDGVPEKKEFSFPIGDKQVTGWAAVFLRGSRSKAGFSVLHNNRVIRGWPDAYRPSSIFGEARNDLINQRLVGEIDLGAFEISHTKDQIIFGENEEDELESKLSEELVDYVRIARSFRKMAATPRIEVASHIASLEKLFSEDLASDAASRIEATDDTDEEAEVITETTESLCEYIIRNSSPNKTVLVNSLSVNLYISSDVNEQEQYVLYHHDSESTPKSLGIVININHPYYSVIASEGELVTFFRHSIYDAFCLWDISKEGGDAIISRLERFSYLKDELLRSPVDIESDDLGDFLRAAEHNGDRNM